MGDVLDKVRRLIALAGSGNEHEARNAAYVACKLIRENKLEVISPGAFNMPPRSPFNPRATDPTGFTDLMDVIINMRTGRVHVGPPETRPAHRVVADEVADEIFSTIFDEDTGERRRSGMPRTQQTRPPMRKRSTVEVHRGTGALCVEARSKGTCKDCGSKYTYGDWVWLLVEKAGKPGGVVHKTCDPNAILR